MSRTITLSEIRQGKSYHVAGFQQDSSQYAEKLHKMGFVIGTPVELAQVKLSDPMIIQIRGSRIALRRREAEEIFVKEASHA